MDGGWVGKRKRKTHAHAKEHGRKEKKGKNETSWTKWKCGVEWNVAEMRKVQDGVENGAEHADRDRWAGRGRGGAGRKGTGEV